MPAIGLLCLYFMVFSELKNTDRTDEQSAISPTDSPGVCSDVLVAAICSPMDADFGYSFGVGNCTDMEYHGSLLWLI